MRDEQAIEAEIQAKGLNAPRLRPEDIDAQIQDENWWKVPGTACIVYALTLRNGFVVTGISAPVSQQNFDEELGKKIAREKARDEIWRLEGYWLRSCLSGRDVFHVT